MKKYKHLFFDIDRTLWDYDHNSREALNDLYNKYSMDEFQIPRDQFIHAFNQFNELLWSQFRNGLLTKEILRVKRFTLTLENFGIQNQELASRLSRDYIEISPNKTNLFPEVKETLDYLKPKYHLHIITNGFNEVQFRKLKNCGLDHYFKHVVTSDNANSQKPHRRIFEFALNSINAKKKESLMIGDDWDLDIMGAKNYGVDQVFFNPTERNVEGNSTFTIKKMADLKEFL